MKHLLTSLITVFLFYTNSEAQAPLNPGILTSISIPKTGKAYQFQLKRGETCQLAVDQMGIDVILYVLNNQGDSLAVVDSPTGDYGTESFSFKAKKDQSISLFIQPFESENIPNGVVDIRLKILDKRALKAYKSMQKILAKENKRNIQTLDITHFWEAYDSLSTATDAADSISIIQRLYIDRATAGFKQFIAVRPEMNAYNYYMALRQFPKFYASLRGNTMEVFNAQSEVAFVFDQFKEAYDNFTPFKVCFAIGVLSTGGTVTSDYVLIGAELTCSDICMDLSEFTEAPYNQLLPHLSYKGDITQKIRNIVAHECVHTQQVQDLNEEEITCSLLHACLSEGICDFVGEYLVGEQINSNLQEYGLNHKESVLQAFFEDPCSGEIEDWLYNYGRFEDKPADLGYYVGYVFAEAFFEQATDKKQAIRQLIEFRNAAYILDKGGFDTKGLE